jgi:tetratricopeptide (TPR) repeat protein
MSNILIAQNKLTNALFHMRQNDLDKAKELIDAATVDTLFKDQASTWYYHGFIHKELFKQRESQNKKSPYRVVAVESFKNSINLEPDGDFSESSRKNLKYLAETVYNQAATSLNPEEYESAQSNYKFYKEIYSFTFPETDFTEKDIQFNLALATVYGKLAELDSTKSQEYYDKAASVYQEILEVDPDNVSANYNMGILYYNQGVEIVNNMDYSLDLEQLNIVQDKIIALFKKSLPYMLKAYELNPTRKETLIGLQGIYFSLNDTEQSEKYKKELETLEGTEEKKGGKKSSN